MSEVELGRLELRVVANLIRRLNYCRRQSLILSRFFTSEVNLEKRGIRHRLDAAERNALRALRNEISVMHEEISKLMRAEGIDFKT